MTTKTKVKFTELSKTSNIKILNVGCGNDTYGTDYIDLYPQRKEVKKCDIDMEQLPYDDNIFDEVYSTFVFEHLKNPGFALKEMYRVLKKGGKVEIHTNNAGWIFYHNSKSKVLTHYGGYGEGENHNVGGDRDKHYALYTFHHIENHLDDVGFINIKVELYRRDEKCWWWGIRLTNWILQHSRFKWTSYPQIKATGEK